MSAAAATAKTAKTAAAPAATTLEEAPAPKSRKKLILMIAGALALVLVGGGVGTVFILKNKANAQAEASEGQADAAGPVHAKPEAKRDLTSTPLFVPLDPFTVNLADREAERYVQIAVTLEIEDSKLADRVKSFMPAIRSNILLAIADRTASELMGREGKASLAERIKRETARGMGYELPPEAEADAGAGAEGKPTRKAAKKTADADLPVKAVHFSNFIIQ